MVGVYSNFLKTHFVKRKKMNSKYTNSANPCVGNQRAVMIVVIVVPVGGLES